jgi:dimethylhistidine N-methyltransferase
MTNLLMKQADNVSIDQAFARAVLEGLSKTPKAIPSRYFYDQRGSELFEKITHLSAYYPTRTEIHLLQHHAAEIAAELPEETVIVEFGSGSSRKTPLLLQALENVAAYVPVDISGDFLQRSATMLAKQFPDIPILPIHADFMEPIAFPPSLPDRPRMGFFPGSTIGNFAPPLARQFLAMARESLGVGAFMLIGVDLQKSHEVLLRAYDDEEGVTAAFNKNLLVRINNELAGTFDPDHFAHEARYNLHEHRIEMHLVSLKSQTVCVLGEDFSFEERESIHTENSCKYTLEGFARLASGAGWSVKKVWTDDSRYFSLQLLQTAT